MRIAKSILICLLTSLSCWAQDPSVVYSAGGEEVAFGATFDLTLRRSWPERFTARPFDAAALSTFHAHIVDREEDRSNGMVVETLRLQLHAFQAGELVIPPTSLRLVDPDGTEFKWPSNTLTLKVTSVLPADDSDEIELPELTFKADDEAGSNVWLPLVSVVVLFAFVLVLRKRQGREVRRDESLADVLVRIREGLSEADDLSLIKAELDQAVRRHVSQTLGHDVSALTADELLSAVDQAASGLNLDSVSTYFGLSERLNWTNDPLNKGVFGELFSLAEKIASPPSVEAAA